MAEQTLNVPQLVVFIVLAFLGVRWYLRKPAAGSTRPTGQSHGVRIDPAQIDQVAQMFPQLDRRQIAWDLQRNGGNVSATTERVLTGRRLDTPPPSFNPPAPRAASTAQSATPAAKPTKPDLITRYNLASRVGVASEAAASDSASKPKAWSADRNERQANMQRKREEMILAARRKMEAQEKGKAKASGTSAS
ncbi:hypothetical protein K491DRAFT_707598 [Lophiostoma macrostomum CBS 122681]|uniref:Coupling of ubiquitin conjugation to ER degradation protein 1 n=1 Tax=Lophiostoma macrostomum CBS 122681 TaxID=1314788 RepID=A0A6A6SS82_9PLEO|nr:hypothetical protein K491DRAFT_707598 [Lophiostoma macrostomum CBS 122681]